MQAPAFLACSFALVALAGCFGGEADRDEPASGAQDFIIASASFQDGGTIPRKHTCDGEEVSPALTITGAPEGTVSLAVTAKDPDVPTPQAPNRTINHWVVWDVPVGGAVFPEGGVPVGAQEGANDFGHGWLGPCPPPTSPPHRYNFTAHALDVDLDLPENSTVSEVEAAMRGHVLATARLTGLYARELPITSTPSMP